VEHPLPQLLRAGLDERRGDLHRRVGHHGVEHGLAELALDPRPLGLGELLGDVRAQLREAVEAGVVRGEVVVELGQLLGLDLLDGQLEARLPPARCSAW
jgi:hypothetical protein